MDIIGIDPGKFNTIFVKYRLPENKILGVLFQDFGSKGELKNDTILDRIVKFYIGHKEFFLESYITIEESFISTINCQIEAMFRGLFPEQSVSVRKQNVIKYFDKYLGYNGHSQNKQDVTEMVMKLLSESEKSFVKRIGCEIAQKEYTRKMKGKKRRKISPSADRLHDICDCIAMAKYTYENKIFEKKGIIQWRQRHESTSKSTITIVISDD